MRISSNYGLKLMEGTDNVKRQDFVDNFSKIDTEMRAIENEAYPIVEATGTNAYIGANVRIQSLKKGTKLTLFVGTNATGNCSLNLNSYGAKNIKDSNGNIVTNMKANIPYNLCYNGTDFILQGKGGGGNLIPKYLLAGYYGEGDNGRVDGTMANNGAVTSTLTAGTSYTIPAGYHNGSGKITANSLASQTTGNAGADSLLNGHTAWVFGSKLTGTIPRLSENSNITFTNDNATKVIVGDQAFGPINNSDGNNRVLIRYSGTNGYITGNTLVGISTSNMASTLGITANKIVAGNNICGVNGTAESPSIVTSLIVEDIRHDLAVQNSFFIDSKLSKVLGCYAEMTYNGIKYYGIYSYKYDIPDEFRGYIYKLSTSGTKTYLVSGDTDARIRPAMFKDNAVEVSYYIGSNGVCPIVVNKLLCWGYQ